MTNNSADVRILRRCCYLQNCSEASRKVSIGFPSPATWFADPAVHLSTGITEGLSPPRAAPTQSFEGNGFPPFDIRQMASALPPNVCHAYEARRQSAQYGMINPAFLQHMPPFIHFGGQCPAPTIFARAQQQQQQQYLLQPYDAQPAQFQAASRPQPAQLQTQPDIASMDRYPYDMNQPAISLTHMRFPQQGSPNHYGPPSGYANLGNSQKLCGQEDTLLIERF